MPLPDGAPHSLRREVRDLVEAALAIRPEARADFIRNASRGNESLSDEALRAIEQVSRSNDHSRTVLLPAESFARLRDVFLLGDESDTADRNEPPGIHVRADAASEPKAIGENYDGKPRFDIRARLGAGGFGSVYEAYDRKQKRVVALKVLRRQQFVDRFKRELRALVDIRHPNLVELYELFCEGSTWFFTMELVHGVDFLTYVEHRPGKQPEAACNMTRLRAAAEQLAQAIRALHQRGILHRDIKPGNVLVSAAGQVRLLDFGLVR